MQDCVAYEGTCEAAYQQCRGETACASRWAAPLMGNRNRAPLDMISAEALRMEACRMRLCFRRRPGWIRPTSAPCCWPGWPGGLRSGARSGAPTAGPAEPARGTPHHDVRVHPRRMQLRPAIRDKFGTCYAAQLNRLQLREPEPSIRFTGRRARATASIPSDIYKMVPFIATLVVLAFSSKKSQAPRAVAVPYDKGSR